MENSTDVTQDGKKPVKLDEIDRKIIRILEENGRTPNNKIANLVKVSEGTVRNRILKLVNSGFMKISALVNPTYIIEKQCIFLGVRVAMNKDTIKTAETVIKLPNVKSVAIVTGRFDLLVEVFIAPHKLIDFLSKDIPPTGAVVAVESFVTLKTFNKWV